MKRKQLVVFCIVWMLLMFMGAGLWAGETKKININTATVEELVQLKRIGAAYAARIVEYREKNGPFKKPEDIMLVTGISDKTWELNKDNIRVE